MRILLLISALGSSVFFSFSQERKIPLDTIITTNHSTTIKGAKINYVAEAGMQPLWSEDNKIIATLQYTYYKKTNVDDSSKRPLLISFNGGPGSASVWMHMAYTGPRVINIDDEGYPIQPYGIKNNPYSVLDTSDIVFINPVNTGYSRMIANENGKLPERKKFFGINADINYLSEWIETFISRKNRWLSPKFIIGESYGGTRVSGLAWALQNKQNIYLNGVILVSPADYKMIESDSPISIGIDFPYYTATAWHHKMLSPALQNKDLLEILPEAEDFALNEFIPALAKGGSLPNLEKEKIAEKMSYYSGISKKAILDLNLQLNASFFWKELLRERDGLTIGRLDSRYKGLDKQQAGIRPDSNQELVSWLHSFTPPINHYLKNELKFITDTEYKVFGDVHPWDRQNNNTREQLRKAMATNPFLNVMYQSGYYDGATSYFAAKYSMWQLDPSGKLKDRFTFKGYRSGHMMYLRKEDLEQSNQDLRDFINKSSTPNQAAKY